MLRASLAAAALLCSMSIAKADTLQVGPSKTYATPSAAAAAAQDGDVIEIDAGLYAGDAAVWRADNLTIRGVGGLAHLRADGVHAEGKGIWVIKGDNTTVENIEFSGATVPDENGAGIRQEGAGLTVRGCYFHDNENGILAGDNLNSDILIEHSHFANNGFGDGFTHNMYINHVRTFTLRYSYTHHAKIGHNVKTRAHVNYVLYNRIMDESTGTSSYGVDFSNGGTSYLIGNLIHQGTNTDNSSMVSYAREGASNPSNDLYVLHNTMVNDRSIGIFLNIQSRVPAAVVRNNIFVGNGSIQGPNDPSGNCEVADPMLADPSGYDYRLQAGSPCIDTGVAPGTGGSFDLTPTHHYVHTAMAVPRQSVDTIDPGAYEYGSPADPIDAGPGAGPDANDPGGDRDGGSSSGDGDGGGCCDAGQRPLSSGLVLLAAAAWLGTRRRRS